jgi:hypothetical protein
MVGSKPLQRRYLWLAIVAFATLTVTAYIRHSLIEPVSMGVYCESSSSWGCMIRRVSIFALQDSRLAWAALSLVALAYLTRVFLFALLGWAIACAGLVLYTAELCSIALLLAGLVSILERQIANKTGSAIQSQ